MNLAENKEFPTRIVKAFNKAKSKIKVSHKV